MSLVAGVTYRCEACDTAERSLGLSVHWTEITVSGTVEITTADGSHTEGVTQITFFCPMCWGNGSRRGQRQREVILGMAEDLVDRLEDHDPDQEGHDED